MNSSVQDRGGVRVAEKAVVSAFPLRNVWGKLGGGWTPSSLFPERCPQSLVLPLRAKPAPTKWEEEGWGEGVVPWGRGKPFAGCWEEVLES